MFKPNVLQKQYQANDMMLNYYEIENTNPVLVLIHAQSTDAFSYEGVFRDLAKEYHIYAIECPGHGKSDHNLQNYNIVSIGNAFLDFIEHQIQEPIYVLGHSSGGLIAAYVAAHLKNCKGVILEDPPFFSCQGERRFMTYNYQDLSSICHTYLETKCEQDFVLYYFEHQKMWEYFPDKSREKIKTKLVACASKYRKKHPSSPLKVPFFPKAALAAYAGMNEYDPNFGETFYNDTFHAGIPHEEILSKITCPALFMKAQTNYGEDGVLLAALSEEDLNHVMNLIPQCKTVRFDCGHGIHIEKKKEFLQAIHDFCTKG